MDIRKSVFKRKSKGDHRRNKWVCRISFRASLSEPWKTHEWQFDTKTHAIDFRDEEIDRLKDTNGRSVAGKDTTFRSLAERALESYYQPAQVDRRGYKAVGVRSHVSVKGYIKNLVEYFGDMRLSHITEHNIRGYISWRHRTGSRRGRDGGAISQATVNRELSTMARMWRQAYLAQWVQTDIFKGADFIRKDAEVERKRRLSPAEESRLLKVCEGVREVEYTRFRHGRTETIKASVGSFNPELKAIILLAIDGGMRRGEILKLRWEDIDFQKAVIRIVGTHTKTEKERWTILGARAGEELRRFPNYGTEGQVFSVKEFRRSWETAKRLAKIEDLRFHDLRRTAITRWIMDGRFQGPLAQKLAGHARFETTEKHYVGFDSDIASEAAARWNQLQAVAIEGSELEH